MTPYQRLLRYTISLAREALVNFGLPHQLEEIDEERKGRLQAAFAVELAWLIAALLIERWKDISSGHKLFANASPTKPYYKLLQLEGGLIRDLDYTARERSALEMDLSEVGVDVPFPQIYAGRVSPRDFEIDTGCSKNLRALRLLEKDEPPSPFVKAKGEAYVNCVARLRETSRRLHKCRDKIHRLLDRNIKNALRAQSTDGVDLEGLSSFLDGDLPELLHQHASRWWGDFAHFVRHRTQKDLNDSSFRLTKRDSRVLAGISSLAKTKGTNQDGMSTWREPEIEAEVLSNLEKYVPRCGYVRLEEPIRVGTIRVWNSRIREEDIDNQNWLENLGGVDHPYNFYKATLETSANAIAKGHAVSAEPRLDNLTSTSHNSHQIEEALIKMCLEKCSNNMADVCHFLRVELLKAAAENKLHKQLRDVVDRVALRQELFFSIRNSIAPLGLSKIAWVSRYKPGITKRTRRKKSIKSIGSD
jgi:hypothetical protein